MFDPVSQSISTSWTFAKDNLNQLAPLASPAPKADSSLEEPKTPIPSELLQTLFKAEQYLEDPLHQLNKAFMSEFGDVIVKLDPETKK